MMHSPVWCNTHHAPFKDGVTRWCKKSNPGDHCEVDQSSLPPRRLPMTALFMLGKNAEQPGWLAFLIKAKEQGFGIDQPGDHDLSEEQWTNVAMVRVSSLAAAFEATHSGSRPGGER